jgi:hypothetical protein
MQRKGKRHKARNKREHCDIMGSPSDIKEAVLRWKAGLKERASVMERLLGLGEDNPIPTPVAKGDDQ